ncbi:MAG TPA: hypothetical protein PKX52_06525 [Methanomassiliicoccaceae archaeon]|jgi:hypothetical protein|nr:hypothetical protein [Euryarchaeota archaeon]HOB38155.1 hypothetical protein [Methanomassiliicoccaceae archaeon]HOQ26847.1 hypothetical protein [Methanomassiliicoccaceae archaeon]HPT74540.1 hypothetical protein [Methanomassiliicoccaceae archaeon]HQA21655.1 hypothetical protein [Methanomassiliicoccaceae archaeon]
MDREAVLRRAIHLSAPLYLVYYFLPSPLWSGGPPREVGLLAVLLIVLLVEALRLVIGFHVPGLRGYEATRMSAGAWAAIGLAFVMLFFPLSLVAPVVVGMALIDPLISVLRRTPWYPWIPLVAHFILVLATLLVFYAPSVQVLGAAALASPLAVGVEALRSKRVDDDFLMVVVPLIGMSIVMML